MGADFVISRPIEPASQLVLVALLVLVLALLVLRLYLAPYFARRELDRMDVHVSGIRQQRGRDYGKVACGNVLSRDPEYVRGCEHASNGVRASSNWVRA